MPLPISPIKPITPLARVPLPRPGLPTQTPPIPPNLRNPPNQRTPFPGAPRGGRPGENEEFCSGENGEWCVSAIVPTKTPKQICYSYPNQSTICVEAENYTVSQPFPLGYFEGGQCRVMYDVSIRNINSGSTLYYGRLFGKITGWGITPSGLTGILNDNDGFINIDNPSVLNFYKNNYRIILSRADGQPDNCGNIPVDCIFKIFDANGSVIHQETRDVCPEVEVIPEKCEFNPKNKQIIARYRKIALLLDQYLKIEVEDNCIEVRIFTRGINDTLPSSLLFKSVIARVCSPEGCPPPQYEVECPCDLCKNKKCPEGTVTRVLTGNQLQCVDTNDCVIKTIPFDKDCETYDCTC